MKKLKQRSLKATLPAIIILWIIAIICFIPGISTLVTLIKGPQDLETVDFSGDIDGLYVSGTLYGIYDAYCEETKDNRTVYIEYIIDAGDVYYMGMRVPAKDIDKADALMYASFDYLDGIDDGTNLVKHQYTVKGTIKKMPSDSLSLYHEYLEWNTLDAETQSTFLPYYLCTEDIGMSNMSVSIIAGIVGIVLFVIGLVMLIRNISGYYLRSVTNYIEKSPNAITAREKVDYFLNNTPIVKGLQYNQDFICGQDGGKTVFGETSKLVWAYLHTVNHKRYFITVSKTHSIILAFADGTRHSVTMKKEQFVLDHLNTLKSMCPQAIIGYSDELNQAFTKNFLGFLNLQYNQVMNSQTTVDDSYFTH